MRLAISFSMMTDASVHKVGELALDVPNWIACSLDGPESQIEVPVQL